MNIANFMQWFLTQFYSLGTQILSKLDNIYIANGISLLKFTITIAIIGAFISIIITAPQLGVVNRELNRRDAEARYQRRKAERNKSK